MRQVIYICALVLLLSSCYDSGSEKKRKGPTQYEESNQDTIKVNVHEDILWSEVKLVGDLGSENNLQLKKNNEKAFTNLKYQDDLILVTCYFEISGCGNNVGNIKINNDTLFLLLPATSNGLCSEIVFYKVTYLIRNSNKKKFKILK